MHEITLRVNDKELRRLRRVAKHLDYDNEGELITTIIDRLCRARLSRDGHLYEATS
ncbi:Uncharacterised protein [Klebsiella quasivariicola]|uniref:Uncharacterized protein n=1 Tax=Klebsiella quasivariicola TaxID=2026240 RepID=A0A8B4TNC4_9ENTR|nr:Uncharacterised protein [Klebsiella quasivariicola]